MPTYAYSSILSAALPSPHLVVCYPPQCSASCDLSTEDAPSAHAGFLPVPQNKQLLWVPATDYAVQRLLRLRDLGTDIMEMVFIYVFV